MCVCALITENNLGITMKEIIKVVHQYMSCIGDASAVHSTIATALSVHGPTPAY